MIYEKITKMCADRGVTPYAVEKACGLGNGTIGKMASPDTSPTLRTIKKIANYFGMTASELIRGEEET